MTAVMPPRRAWVEQIMGMPISVHLRGPDLRTSRVQRMVAELFADLRDVDAVFSTYRPDSLVSRLNRGEVVLADCADPVPAVADLCDQARQRTDGFFDAWLPGPDGGPRFDPSGLVKTWGVAYAARRLADLDGHDLCLNAGGDVLVRTAGRRPSSASHDPAHHPAWRIGIEDPHDPARLLGAVTLADGAVATSGGAHRGAHILDPRTGQPATEVRAVTVVGPSLMWADIYATAAVARGRDAVDWLETREGYEALLVDALGAVTTTSGWPRGEVTPRVPARPAPPRLGPPGCRSTPDNRLLASSIPD